MARSRALPAAAALAAAIAAPLAGQSLGEAARKEQERRAAIRKPAPSYDDSDLAGRRGSAPPASPSPVPSPTAGLRPSPAAEDESVERRRQEAAWRARFEAARERVRQAEERAWRTVIETVFVSGIPVQQQVRKFEETAELRQARTALADLEEEFRRTGLPAGWAR